MKLLAPIPNPGMVLSVGMNYHEHLKEMKTPVPEKPAAFTKSVASIIGSDEPIRVPPGNPDMLDWEGEFSVVIGRPCHRVSACEALDPKLFMKAGDVVEVEVAAIGVLRNPVAGV